MNLFCRSMAMIWLVAPVTELRADNLFGAGNWPALASDRKASRVGDILTLLVVENSQASNSVTKGSRKRNGLDASVTSTLGVAENVGGTLGGQYEGQGSNGRTDKMFARLSVTVVEVFPNGDMRVAGLQRLKINGETTSINVSGRVRSDDITPDNSVLSWRLADAVIDYDGKGFATRSAKPGVVGKIFSWLGLY